MMYSLERFGRNPPAVTAFLLTAVFGLLWANAGSEGMVLAIGFGMIFFIQLAGNSSQDFISEVIPTNARASGFGLCQSAGRVGAFVGDPGLPVDPAGLRPDRCVRGDRRDRGDRRPRGDPDWPRSQGPRPRGNRAADRVRGALLMHERGRRYAGSSDIPPGFSVSAVASRRATSRAGLSPRNPS